MSWVFLIVPIHGSYCHITSRPLSFFLFIYFLFFYFFRFCAFLGILGGVPGFLGGVPGFLGAVPGFRWCSGFLDVPVFRCSGVPGSTTCRSLCSNLGGIDPEKLYRATLTLWKSFRAKPI